MKLFRRIKKLRTKLLIIFTFQVFLLLGIALLVSFFLARSSSRKNLQMLNQQLKTLADSDFQDIFDEIDRAYLSIVASSNFSELYNARSDSTPLEIYELYYDVDNLLTAPLASSRYIHSINYLTPDNKTLISSIAGELSMERDFSVEESPEWFWLHTRLLNTVGSLSETYIPPHQELYYQRTSSSANRTVVSVVRKTASFDTGYKNRGLLYFNVELSDFVSLTDSLNLYPDMETVILTDTGRVIHDSSGSITEQTGNIALLRECTSEQPITLDGKKYMAVPVTMKDPGWSICSLIPWSVYTADIRGYTVYSLVLGMLVFIAGFIMTWIMSARISAPAEELSRTMKSVRSGNIRQHASVISSDEIGELSATFNTMLDRINLLIEQGNATLNELGYTEHSRKHAAKVAETAGKILKDLGYGKHKIELAKIAGYMHDIGNAINRHDHAHSGAILAYQILKDTELPLKDILVVSTAIGHHDEATGTAVDPVSAALILADKTDVRRNRVQNRNKATFDIHDRVNYAALSSKLIIEKEKRIIQMELELDDSICTVMDYFEIFLKRMIMCRRAAERLNCKFKLMANGSKLC